MITYSGMQMETEFLIRSLVFMAGSSKDLKRCTKLTTSIDREESIKTSAGFVFEAASVDISERFPNISENIRGRIGNVFPD